MNTTDREELKKEIQKILSLPVSNWEAWLRITEDKLLEWHEAELKKQREGIVKRLDHIDESKWHDAVHCTCLPYAIDMLRKDTQ